MGPDRKGGSWGSINVVVQEHICVMCIKITLHLMCILLKHYSCQKYSLLVIDINIFVCLWLKLTTTF